jgi:L-lactate dehydrogenase
MTEQKYLAADMTAFATELLVKTGMEADKAEVVAEVLLEGDLMGHTTHGFQLLAPYLGTLESGEMNGKGEPDVLNDTGPAITWDGKYLPGTWLCRKGLDLAAERAAKFGMAAIAIRRSHHIASLASYLKRVTDQGMMAMVFTSDPAVGGVAPFGGLMPLYTPDPIGIGIPTDGEPILIDISMSTTTIGLVSRLNAQGKKLPHAWVQDNKGNATDDPAAFFTDPPGSILPIGGKDHGHKGFALGLYVEAMTSALSGYGRASEPEHWGGSVFLQVYNPALFGGVGEFQRETSWLVDACKNNPVAEGADPVRIPGARGLKLRDEMLANGVEFHAGIIDALKPWAEKHNVAMPSPRA